MASTAIPLGYERPLRTNEVRIDKQAEELSVQVGPPPTATLVSMLLPLVLMCAAGAIGIWAVWAKITGHATQLSGRGLLILPLVGLAGAARLALVAKHRNGVRTLVVRDGVLYFGALEAGGRMVSLPIDVRWRMKVCRRWYSPWQARLEARAAMSFWELRRPIGPIVLLAGPSRAQLTRIADALHAAMRTAPRA